ncbi:peptidase M50 [Litorimonas cladophorae]|uniref:Peptidase M50 n=2 Tax=Litorimonas cladophorae TaxID=1220491 RepID=A0A918KTF1_9PROT|nr:peptidase M50 [Litorimonas cladophorae]
MVRIPIMFTSTWAHELGHGLGAVFTGGRFIELTVFPNFSGVAQTATVNDFQRAMVIIVGLLGPSLLGVLMIILTRALNWYRIAIIVLAALLAMSQIWAADSFTQLTLASGTLALGLVAWKVPNQAVLYIAHIIAIGLCLNALTGFGYFFIGNAEVAGSLYRSDSGVLSDIIGGPHWFWGGLIAALSILILFAGVVLSDKWARRKDIIHPP